MPARLDVAVAGHETHDFTEFAVRVAVAGGAGAAPWVVKRRYNAFLELHNALVSKNYRVPAALPPKQWLGRFAPDFLDARQRALHDYLRQLAADPLVGDSALLLEFLEVNEGTLSASPPDAPPDAEASTAEDAAAQAEAEAAARAAAEAARRERIVNEFAAACVEVGRGLEQRLEELPEGLSREEAAAVRGAGAGAAPRPARPLPTPAAGAGLPAFACAPVRLTAADEGAMEAAAAAARVGAVTGPGLVEWLV